MIRGTLTNLLRIDHAGAGGLLQQWHIAQFRGDDDLLQNIFGLGRDRGE